jgi:hypothetical protein
MIDPDTQEQPGKNIWSAKNLLDDEFHRLHGPKLDGPRNETERALLEASELLRQAINGMYDN